MQLSKLFVYVEVQSTSDPQRVSR